MKRWLSVAAVLCVAGATPLVAQQASSPAPTAGVRAAQASSATPTLPGPRLQPEWRRVQPTFADSSASASAAVADTHTITVTTLVLVLVVIIAVLLIAN
jgi:hypothetical protein